MFHHLDLSNRVLYCLTGKELNIIIQTKSSKSYHRREFHFLFSSTADLKRNKSCILGTPTFVDSLGIQQVVLSSFFVDILVEFYSLGGPYQFCTLCPMGWSLQVELCSYIHRVHIETAITRQKFGHLVNMGIIHRPSERLESPSKLWRPCDG